MKRGLFVLIIVIVAFVLISTIYLYAPREVTKGEVEEGVEVGAEEGSQLFCESHKDCVGDNCAGDNCLCTDNECVISEITEEPFNECVIPGQSADEYSFGQYMGPKRCCEGLTSIDVMIEKNGECLSLNDGGSICSDCGNNVCEEWENSCNCPIDCS